MDHTDSDLPCSIVKEKNITTWFAGGGREGPKSEQAVFQTPSDLNAIGCDGNAALDIFPVGGECAFGFELFFFFQIAVSQRCGRFYY